MILANSTFLDLVRHPLEMFFTFAIPLAVVGAYFRFAQRIRDTRVFVTGLVSTIHFACWIGLILAMFLWHGPSGYFNIIVGLLIIYLLTIAPLIAIALWFTIWYDRMKLEDYGFAMTSNLAYFLIFGVLPWCGIFLFFGGSILSRGLGG